MLVYFRPNRGSLCLGKNHVRVKVKRLVADRGKLLEVTEEKDTNPTELDIPCERLSKAEVDEIECLEANYTLFVDNNVPYTSYSLLKGTSSA